MGFLDKLINKDIERSTSLEDDLKNIVKAKSGKSLAIEYTDSEYRRYIVLLNSEGKIAMVYDHRDPLDIESRMIWGTDSVYSDFVESAAKMSKGDDGNRYRIFVSTFSHSPAFIEYIGIIYRDYAMQKGYDLEQKYSSDKIVDRKILDVNTHDVAKMVFLNLSVEEFVAHIEDAHDRERKAVEKITQGEDLDFENLIVQQAIGLDEQEDTDKVIIAASEASDSGQYQSISDIKKHSTGFLFADIIERISRANERGWLKLVEQSGNPIQSFKSKPKDLPRYSQREKLGEESAFDVADSADSSSVEELDNFDDDFENNFNESQDHAENPDRIDDEKLAAEMIERSEQEGNINHAVSYDDMFPDDDMFSHSPENEESSDSAVEESVSGNNVSSDAFIEESEETDSDTEKETDIHSVNPFEEDEKNIVPFGEGEVEINLEGNSSFENEDLESPTVREEDTVSSSQSFPYEEDNPAEDEEERVYHLRYPSFSEIFSSEKDNEEETVEDLSENDDEVSADQVASPTSSDEENLADKEFNGYDNSESFVSSDENISFNPSVSTENSEEEDHEIEEINLLDEEEYFENEETSNSQRSLPIVDSQDVSLYSIINSEEEYGDDISKGFKNRDGMSAVFEEMIKEKHSAQQKLNRIPEQENSYHHERKILEKELNGHEGKIEELERLLEEARVEKDVALEKYENLSHRVDEKHSAAVKSRHRLSQVNILLERLKIEEEFYSKSVKSAIAALEKAKKSRPVLIEEFIEALEEFGYDSDDLRKSDESHFDIDKEKPDNSEFQDAENAPEPDQIMVMEDEGGGVIDAVKVEDRLKFRGDFIENLESENTSEGDQESGIEK